MPRLRDVVVLAALVAVAGCTGAAVAPDGELTVTPAPVPTDGTPTPAYRLAPGLDETGVVGPLTLATAHAELLRSSVYHVHIEERVTHPDGRVRWRVLEGTFANRTAYAFEVREGVDDETVLASSFYADGRRLYQRLVTDDGVRYYVPRDRLGRQPTYPEDPIGGPTQFDELYVAVVGASPDYVDTEPVDGVDHYRLRSSGGANDDFLAAWEYVDGVSDYELEALVRPDGLVRSYRITYVATVGDERRRVVRTARWTEVGEASVPEPAWSARAANRTTSAGR